MRYSTVLLIFLLFGSLVFANALNGKFLWDDQIILNDPTLSQTKFIFSQWNPNNNKYYSGYYRPMAHMLYTYCYGNFKNTYWKYHLLNLLFFILLSSLIYLLIVKLSKDVCLAFLSAVFFLLHPINGIMVNNIVTSALDVQVIFMLVTMTLAWEALERRCDRRFYFLSLCSAFVSLFWYEMGVLTPFYLSPMVLILRNERLKDKLVFLTPFFVISLGYLLFRHFFLKGTPLSINVSIYHMTLGEHIATVFCLIKWYLSKMIFLKGIVMQWLILVVHSHVLECCLAGGFAVIGFTYLIFHYSRDKIIRFAGAWILIGFLPLYLVGFADPDNGAMLEPHWFTFSTIGIFIIVACCCLYLLKRIKWLGFLCLFIMIFAFSSFSRSYNQLWSDQKTYTLYWSKQLPNFKFLDAIIGQAYLMDDNFSEAEKYFRMANHGVSISPLVCMNIGVVEFQQKHFKKAESIFKLALKMNPRMPLALTNLAAIYLMRGDTDRAKVYYSQALVYDSSLIVPRYALAAIAAGHSEYKEAIRWCLENLNLKENDVNTLILLIDIYVKQKDFVSAQRYALSLIRTQNDPILLTKLGAVMARDNLINAALACYDKALHIAPNYKNAYLDKGTFLAGLGKYDLAVSVWNKGLRLYPDDRRFKDYIDHIKLKHGKKN